MKYIESDLNVRRLNLGFGVLVLHDQSDYFTTLFGLVTTSF